METAEIESTSQGAAELFSELCENIRQLPRFGSLEQPVASMFKMFRFKALLILESGKDPFARCYQLGQTSNPIGETLTAPQYGQFLKARQRIGYLPLHHCKYSKNKQVLRNIRQSRVFECLEEAPSEIVMARAMNQDGKDLQFVMTGFDNIDLSDQCLATLSYVTCMLSTQMATETRVVPSARLSRRQTECLWWISKGKTSDEISELVGISKHTINNYIANASKKLGTANRTEAICLAIRQGLI